MPTRDHHDHEYDDHDHGDHAPPAEAPPTGSELLERAISALLIEKGVITEAEIQRQMNFMASRNPALGARIVAKAWADPAFKQALVASPRETLQEHFAIDIGTATELKVIENGPRDHHVVTCTLCSCYPRLILGPPPAWYKSFAYRSRVVVEPRAVLKEFGFEPPRSTAVHVHDSTADLRYLIIPRRPAGTEGWSEAELARLVTRDSMIGTAPALEPAAVA
jgi:nitrile hydratase